MYFDIYKIICSICTQNQSQQLLHMFVVTLFSPIFRAGSCTSELQLKMNCRLQVNCKKCFCLVCQMLAEPAQILFYNSLSAAIRLYMIWALVNWFSEFRINVYNLKTTAGCRNAKTRNLFALERCFVAKGNRYYAKMSLHSSDKRIIWIHMAGINKTCTYKK